MSKILPKIFIKDYKNIDDPKVRNNYGKLAGIAGIVTNALLSFSKIFAGIISVSMAIIADGLNNLSDASSSIITYIGFKASIKPADKDHPFGHQRAEYITGLIISFFIIFVGASLFKSGLEKIINPEEIKPTLFILIFMGASIIIKIWQFYFYRSNGRLINSKTLIATSIDSLNDVITTSAVLLSLLLSYYIGWNIDGYMTLFVSLIIIYNGIKLVKGTISPLLGEAPPKDLIVNVTNDILAYKGVLGLHDLVIHTYGPNKTFITVHVEVEGKTSIMKSHNMIDDIERYINEKYSTSLVIHMDPVETKDEYAKKIKIDIIKILNEIDLNFDIHDFRIVKGEDLDNIIFDLEIPEGFIFNEAKMKETISNELKKYNPRFNLIINFDIIFNNHQ